ncbi:MAG: hypothetical protein NZ740_05080 [Kiritimatiellae bacterium]|nr:hypothetical protein [Kiritimatiellia bacterium]MDW8458466.1 hypothetical protein [Verrucomicrobiota bacterium]
MIWLRDNFRRWPTPLRWLVVLFISSWLISPDSLRAQILRIGPFDLFAVGRLDAVYTTNVERQRESEATAEMEDYYLIAGLEMNSEAYVSYSTTLTLETGVAWEKHFVREDLDNSTAPFGRLSLESKTDLRTLDINAFFRWEHMSESAETVYIPGGRSSKTRNPNTLMSYGGGVAWENDPFRLFADYEFTSRRYEKEEFQEGDEDQTTFRWGGNWQIRENLGARYENERRLTERVNSPDAEEDWETTERIMLDWRLRLIRRPEFTYSVGLQKEDTDEEEGAWEFRHEFAIRDQIDITPRLKLAGQAMYSIEDNEEADDINFTYGATLDHEISYTARQSLSLTREPRATFGSTKDTDTTSIRYNFSKIDLFIADLSLNLGIGYEINRPADGPEERMWTYNAKLEHERALSRRLLRKLSYDYSRETSNLDEEPLVEHRVTWSYEYQF